MNPAIAQGMEGALAASWRNRSPHIRDGCAPLAVVAYFSRTAASIMTCSSLTGRNQRGYNVQDRTERPEDKSL